MTNSTYIVHFDILDRSGCPLRGGYSVFIAPNAAEAKRQARQDCMRSPGEKLRITRCYRG